MTKLEMLFIRACKSLNTEKRVHSVYKRFYYRHNKNPDPALVSILLNICEKYCPIPSEKLLSELNPDSIYYMGQDKPYWSICLRVLISHIRLTEAVKFDGMIKPLMFRRKQI